MKNHLPVLVTTVLLGGAIAVASVAAPSRIDIDVVESDPELVLLDIAHAMGLDLMVDGGTSEGTLTMRLVGVTPETALLAACESLSCTWKVEGDELLVRLRPAPPGGEAAVADSPKGLDSRLSLSLRDASLGLVLERLAVILGSGADIDEDLRRQLVTVQLQETEIRDVLSRLCEVTECTWWMDEDADALVVRPRAGIGLNLHVEPQAHPDHGDVYLCTAVITDLENGDVLSAPTVIFRRGEGASVQSGMEGGSVVSLDVEVDEAGTAARIVARVTESDRVVVQQSSTFEFEDD